MTVAAPAPLRGDAPSETLSTMPRTPSLAGERPVGHASCSHAVARGVLACVLTTAALAACARATPSPTPVPTATPTATRTATPTLTATPSPTPFPKEAFPRVEQLNLRAGPDPLHPAVGVAGTATPMAIRGRSHDGSWLAVRLPGLEEGWVNATLVALRRDPAGIPTLVTPTPPPSPTPTPTPTMTAVPMDPALPLVLVPPAVAPGDPVLVRWRAPGAAQVLAVLGDRQTALFPVGADTFAGILVADLGLPPGPHPVHLTVIDGGGNSSAHAVDLLVYPEGSARAAEAIRLNDQQTELLDTAAQDEELARLQALWVGISPERLWSGAWQRPVTGTVSSPFGAFRQYVGGQQGSRHSGVDLRGRAGTPVRAPARGRVAMAEPLAIRGNVVWLDHGWGVYSGYFHLSQIAVQPGQVVEPGTLLGAVGSTGRSTAPHLHWELRVAGAMANPVQWLLRDVGAVP